MGRYGNLWFEQTGLVKTVLALPNGIPCPDTFRRVFERINPKVFERCFQRWVQSIVETLGAQVIPIDGKTLKGSYDREQEIGLTPCKCMGK